MNHKPLIEHVLFVSSTPPKDVFYFGDSGAPKATLNLVGKFIIIIILLIISIRSCRSSLPLYITDNYILQKNIYQRGRNHDKAPKTHFANPAAPSTKCDT